MRCGCILVIAAIALIVMGIQGIHEAHAFSKPVEITCEQFMKSAPQEGWYHIKGCEVEVDESVYMVTTYHFGGSTNKDQEKDTSTANDQGTDTAAASDKSSTNHQPKDKVNGKDRVGDAEKANGKDKTNDSDKTVDTGKDPPQDNDPDIKKVYIPVHCPTTWDAKAEKFPATNLVIETSDPGIIETANQLKRLDKQKPEEAKKWLIQNMAKLTLQRDITGMVQTGINSDDDTRKEVAKLQESLTPEFLIVEEGRKPSMSGGLGAMFGGILLGIASVLYWGSYLFRWKQRLT